MRFPVALKALVEDGSKIKRRKWGFGSEIKRSRMPGQKERVVWALNRDDFLDQSFPSCYTTDIFADDWELVPAWALSGISTTMGFVEAMDKLRNCRGYMRRAWWNRPDRLQLFEARLRYAASGVWWNGRIEDYLADDWVVELPQCSL